MGLSRPALLTVAVLSLASGALGYRAALAAQRAEWNRRTPPPLSRQVEAFSSRSRYSVDNPFVGNEYWGVARINKCRALLDSLGLSSESPAKEISIADSTRLAAADPCGFATSGSDLVRPRYLRAAGPATLLAALAGLLVLLVHTVAFYKHQGWRRLSIAIGMLTGTVTAIAALMYAEPLLGTTVIGSVAGILGASAVIGLRELTNWIRRGFGEGSSA